MVDDKEEKQMKVDVRIAGNTYNGVPAVILPLATEGTARFCEVSDTTAKAEDVLQGKTFYNAAGELTMGTAVKQTETVIQSNDVWSVIVNQTDHQTISYSCSSSWKSDEADKYKLELTVTPAVTADAGYTAGEASIETDEENKTITISATPAVEKSPDVNFKGIYGLTLGGKVITSDTGAPLYEIDGYSKADGVGALSKNLLNSDELVSAGIDYTTGTPAFAFASGKAFGNSAYIGIMQPNGNNFKTAKFNWGNGVYTSTELIGPWATLFHTLSQANSEVYVLVSETEFTAEQALAAIAAHN